ncbi:50S ribosomal protein L25 [Abditibacteriota bacterium]|nr:50S ribosomal protein L25 [Abditibacteriota bacterium]
MATLELNVQKRETRGKEAAKVMRREGLLPAVLYGHGQTPVSLSVNAREFGDAMRHHGSTSLIVLKGLGDETALVKSIQRHPYKNTPQTIDFIRVSRGEEVHIKVPVVLTGEPISVRTAEGVLVHSLIEVEIAATPANIPDLISVDISHLELNGPAMHVSEIKAPAGVRILTDGEEAVAVINLPAREEEEVGDVVAEGEEETAEASQQVPAEHGGPQGGGEGLKHETHIGNKSDTPETPTSS